MPSHETSGNLCPHCGEDITFATNTGGERQPPLSGDFAVCVQCGTILRYDTAMTLSLVDSQALGALRAIHPDVWRGLLAARHVIRRLHEAEARPQASGSA